MIFIASIESYQNKPYPLKLIISGTAEEIKSNACQKRKCNCKPAQ